MKRALLFAAFLAFLAIAGPAAAHPHIRIDAKAVLLFDANGRLTGIRHEWVFDEAFSSWSIRGLDKDGDGTTSSEETQELANEHLQGLAEYSFYSSARDGEESLTFAEGRDASLTVEDARTTLRFTVVLDQPHSIAGTLDIAVNDPDYNADITFADPSTVTAEGLPDGCAITLEQPTPLAPGIEEQVSAVPPEQQLPAELAAAVGATRGGIQVRCASAEPAIAVEAAEAVGETGTAPTEPGLVTPRTGLLGWFAQRQHDFYTALTGALGWVKADNNAFWILGSLSFLYGILLAAGPGAAGAGISSYATASTQQLRRGIALNVLSAMLQSVVAVVVIGVASAALALASTATGNAANWISIASYALVVLLGLWLIVRKLFRFGRDHHRDHQRARAHLYGGDEDHGGHDLSRRDHGDSTDDRRHVVTARETEGSWREQLAAVAAAGLWPGSGALVVLVFALSQGVLPAGIVSVFLMGLGTAITVTVLASLAVKAKGFAARLASVDSLLAATVLWWLELVAAIAVFTFGLILLVASL